MARHASPLPPARTPYMAAAADPEDAGQAAHCRQSWQLIQMPVLAGGCGECGLDQNRWNSGWLSCQNVSTTLPMMLEPSIGPQYRLSHESARLSPST